MFYYCVINGSKFCNKKNSILACYVCCMYMFDINKVAFKWYPNFHGNNTFILSIRGWEAPLY